MIDNKDPAQVSAYVSSLFERARVAQKAVEKYTQKQVDQLACAIAWATSSPAAQDVLAPLAYEESNMGDLKSKYGKINKKIKGVFRDIKHQKTVGIMEALIKAMPSFPNRASLPFRFCRRT